MSKRTLVVVAALIALGVGAWIYANRGPADETSEPPTEPAQRERVEAPATETDEDSAPEFVVDGEEDVFKSQVAGATVQMRARLVGMESSKWLLLRVTATEPAARIYPIVGDANSASSDADPTTGEFHTSVRVAAGQVLHLAAYSRWGDLLGKTSTARELQPDETFVWEPVLDLEGLYRDYYFRFDSEPEQVFPHSLPDRFRVDVFDAGVQLWIEASEYVYQAEQVYRMRVPADRAVLAHLNDLPAGVAAWRVETSEGRTEQEPELVRLVERVRVFVPNEIVQETNRGQNHGFLFTTDSLGVRSDRDLLPLPDGQNHLLEGPYLGTTSLRIGQRFYRCAFTEGGDYTLGESPIVEVYSGKLARLQLTLANDPGPDTQVFWRIKKDQVQVSKQAMPFVYLGETAQFEVPVGTVRVEARLGIDGAWVSASIEVPPEGTEHRLVLPD